MWTVSVQCACGQVLNLITDLLFITIEKYVIYCLSFSCRMSKTHKMEMNISRIKIRIAHIYVICIYTMYIRLYHQLCFYFIGDMLPLYMIPFILKFAFSLKI